MKAQQPEPDSTKTQQQAADSVVSQAARRCESTARCTSGGYRITDHVKMNCIHMASPIVTP